jgi:t-SNARE complex subunit (syntaxin)
MDTTDLEVRMTRIRKLASTVKSKLQAMKEANDTIRLEKPGSALYRIRETQYSVVHKIFLEVMREFYKSQTDHREACKNKLKREISIMGKDTTDEELEDMLEKGNVQVFTEGLVADTVAERGMLSDIESRHKEIIELEKSIVDLNHIFVDLGMMVNDQGEVIDSIQGHVEQTRDQVAAGKVEIESARKYQVKARGKKLICAAILLVILIIIIIVVCVQYA